MILTDSQRLKKIIMVVDEENVIIILPGETHCFGKKDYIITTHWVDRYDP